MRAQTSNSYRHGDSHRATSSLKRLRRSRGRPTGCCLLVAVLVDESTSCALRPVELVPGRMKMRRRRRRRQQCERQAASSFFGDGKQIVLSRLACNEERHGLGGGSGGRDGERCRSSRADGVGRGSEEADSFATIYCSAAVASLHAATGGGEDEQYREGGRGGRSAPEERLGKMEWRRQWAWAGAGLEEAALGLGNGGGGRTRGRAEGIGG